MVGSNPYSILVKGFFLFQKLRPKNMDTEILRQTKNALDVAIAEKKRAQDLVSSLGPAIVDTLKPVLDEIANNSKLSKEELLSAVAEIKINVPKADVPQAQVEVKIPEIIIPEPKVTVNNDNSSISKVIEKGFSMIVKLLGGFKIPEPKITIPKIDIPKIVMPKTMEIKGDVGILGVDRDNPLSVIMVDEKGNYAGFNPKISVSGMGGGQVNMATFNGFSVPAYDYVSVEYPGATTETYTLKKGGSGGEVVQTLQLIYFDSGKSILKTVTKL